MIKAIRGVWKTSKLVYVSGDKTSIIEPALPGRFIFTEKHYSMTWMTGSELQSDYNDLWHPSDAEKIQSYNAIVTNSGRYELSGSELTTYVEVAKTPAFIGGKAVYQCEIIGDSMQLEIRDNVAHDGTRDEGYLKFKTRIHLKRVE